MFLKQLECAYILCRWNLPAKPQPHVKRHLRSPAGSPGTFNAHPRCLVGQTDVCSRRQIIPHYFGAEWMLLELRLCVNSFTRKDKKKNKKEKKKKHIFFMTAAVTMERRVQGVVAGDERKS